MKIFVDLWGNRIRFTEERLAHILEHPEMAGQKNKIKETLQSPESVIQSLSDERARLYYRLYFGTAVGDKHLCVVVKFAPKDTFLVTAYFTDLPKKGEIIWKR